MTVISSPVLPNINYRIDAFEQPAPCERIDSDEPFSIVCASLVRDVDKDFDVFKELVKSQIREAPQDTLLIVLPEYCWRTTPPEQVFEFIEELKSLAPRELTIILGTLEFTLNGSYTNNAIVLHDGRLWYIPKTKILSGEVKAGVSRGENPGVIVLPRFNLAVLVCADLWENKLLKGLVSKQKADIVAVPAWTATSLGNRKFGRREWRSLATAEALRRQVVIAVADHFENRPASDVCNATIVCNPADRRKKRPKGDIKEWVSLVNLKEVRLAAERWKERGLALLEVC